MRLFSASARVNQARKRDIIVELTKDTPTTDPTPPHDPQKTSSGSPEAIGGKDAPAQTASDTSHSGEAYPGPAKGGEADKTNPNPEGKR